MASALKIQPPAEALRSPPSGSAVPTSRAAEWAESRAIFSLSDLRRYRRRLDHLISTGVITRDEARRRLIEVVREFEPGVIR